ncbi:uncharacterized protein LOC129180501 isoform X2 [Dunckerocampus dactyliophorus]|uniref:uncharacterized protein LOC129180501 isoform X2 n=1 Tax=Dunckerocampus dactyliophorus TaxID=161453 RepID=UPI002406B1B0|nr:uncharacterized protein LOC129180501 isoform X2 [Dunckerocampus dactyliophorus]
MDHCYAKMATSSQREGGRESTQQIPSKSSTEKKPQTADNDIQQMIGHQEEHLSRLQGRSSTLKQKEPHPPHIKEEDEEFWTTQQGECLLGQDLTKLPLTGVSVKTEDHEDKPPESLRWLCPSHIQQMIGHQEDRPPQPQWGSSTLKQEEPQPPHIEEEDEEFWTTQHGECLLGQDLTKLPLTGVSVKTEDHEDKPPESLRWLCPSHIQQMIGHQEERPPQPQLGSSTFKQEDLQPPYVKQEEEELWVTQERQLPLGSEEAELTKLPLTGFSVKTEDHEDKPPESLRWLCPSHVQQMIGHQEERPPQPQWGSSTLKQEDLQPPCVKQEEEELWVTQERQLPQGSAEADLTKLPQTGFSVKTEDHEDKPPESTQLHHSPSEENRGSTSSQHMTTEADGDHCRGSQADSLVAPRSDSDESDTTSHSSEDEDSDDSQEPLSSDTDCEGDMRTHTDNKTSECSKKETGPFQRSYFPAGQSALSIHCHLVGHVHILDDGVFRSAESYKNGIPVYQ